MANNSRPTRLSLLIIMAILALVSVVLCVLSHLYSRFPGDLEITLWLQSFHSPAILSTMQGISWLFGGWRPIAIVISSSGVVLLRLGRTQAAMVILAGISASTSSLLKLVVGRVRPSSELVTIWDVETNKSFPSGHVLLVTIVLGFLAYLCLTRISNRALKISSVSILAVLIVLTGISRVYLGAHWPSDTLGGYVIGGFLLSILIFIDRFWSSRKTHPG